jgi:Ferritin-like domain
MEHDRLIVTDGDVDTAVVAEYERSRRDLVRSGLVAGGAVVAAAAIPGLLGARNAFAQVAEDEEFVKAAIALEEVSVEAYQRSTGQLAGFARLFRNHERQHLAALRDVLRSLRGEAEQTDVASRLEGLAGAAPQRARFLAELEGNAIAAYVDGHRRVKDAALMKLATSIMGNEAQHLAVLRDLANQEPAPDAFVRGREA